MTKKETLKLFEERKVRTVWDDEKEKWYFSIVDVVSVLTDSVDATAYWRKLKQRLKEEGNETVTNCHGLKMKAATTTYHSVYPISQGRTVQAMDGTCSIRTS